MEISPSIPPSRMQCAAVKTTLKFGALTEVPEQRPRPNGPRTMKMTPFVLVISAAGSAIVSDTELAPASPLGGSAGYTCGLDATACECPGTTEGEPDRKPSSGRARFMRAGVQKLAAARTCESDKERNACARAAPSPKTPAATIVTIANDLTPANGRDAPPTHEFIALSLLASNV